MSVAIGTGESASVDFHGFEGLTAEFAKSPEFTCLGLRWRIDVCPGGNPPSDDGMVSVFLQNASNNSIVIKFSFIARDKSGKEVVRADFGSKRFAPEGDPNKHDGWGTNDFSRHSTLVNTTEDGTLTIQVWMMQMRRHTKEELGEMTKKALIAALGKEGLGTSNESKDQLIIRYLEGKKKPKPMTAAERKRKSRANRSETKKEEDRASKAMGMAVLRGDKNYRLDEQSRDKHRKRLRRGPPTMSQNFVVWNELNRAGSAAHDRRESWTECDALWDEADAIVKKHHDGTIKGADGIRSHKAKLEASDYNAFAVVEGAGTPEVNGHYRWMECGKYEQSTTHNGKKVKFRLFSQTYLWEDCIPSASRWDDKVSCRFTQWRIAIVPAGGKSGVGLGEDTDFYQRPAPFMKEYHSWRENLRTKKNATLTQKAIDKIKKKRRRILKGHEELCHNYPPAESWVCSFHGAQPAPKIKVAAVKRDSTK